MTKAGEGHAAGLGALQPPMGALVPAGWLEEFADSEEARHLAALEADRELVERLMWAAYAGPEWEVFQTRLIAYGYQVLFRWLRSGAIFNRCWDKGYPLKRNPRSRELDEARSLAGETVVLAVRSFRETVLIPRVWRPDRKASLNTFFVGQCLIRFGTLSRCVCAALH